MDKNMLEMYIDLQEKKDETDLQARMAMNRKLRSMLLENLSKM